MTGQRQATPTPTAEQAAIDEWARDLVSTWPPLSDRQREQLRELLDLSGDDRHDPA